MDNSNKADSTNTFYYLTKQDFSTKKFTKIKAFRMEKEVCSE